MTPYKGLRLSQFVQFVLFAEREASNIETRFISISFTKENFIFQMAKTNGGEKSIGEEEWVEKKVKRIQPHNSD